MAYVQRRGKQSFLIGWTDRHGVAKRKTIRAQTKTEARELAEEKERAERRIALGVDDALPERKLFRDLAKLYLETSANLPSYSSMEGRFRLHLLPAFGDMWLDEIRPGDIERFLVRKASEVRCRWSKVKGCDYVGKNLKELEAPCPKCGGRLNPVGPQTREHLRVHLQALYTFAIRKERCFRGENPASVVPKVDLPLSSPKHLQAEWVPAVIAQVSERWRNLFACAVYLGLRKGELLGLQRSAVDLERRTIEVLRSHGAATTKGKKARVVAIPEELVPFVKAQLNVSQASEYLFPSLRGDRQARGVDLPDMLRRALRRAGIVQGYDHVCRRKACGYVERRADNAVSPCPRCKFQLWPKGVFAAFTFKDLRSTFGTYATEMTGDIRFTQQGLGHGDVKITEKHYAKYRPERLLAQADQIRFGAAPHSFRTTSGETDSPPSGSGEKVVRLQGVTARAIEDSNLWPSAPETGHGVMSSGISRNQEVSSGVISTAYARPLVSPSGDRGHTAPTVTHRFRTIDGEALLLPGEVAALLRIPKSSVYRLAKLGRIPPVRIENQLRFRREDVAAYLAGVRR